jgi:hypothetical protein
MTHNINIGNNNIDKHLIYKDKYPKNNIFWGLGIENEVYLEFKNKKKVNKMMILKNHEPERYSIKYYSNYKSEYLVQLLIKLEKELKPIYECPILINSHTFTKTDINNNHKTIYKNNIIPNSDFLGKTVLDILQETDNYFNDTIDKKWTFDGDTIEFFTNDFVNVNLKSVIKELEKNKKEFVERLNFNLKMNNIFQDYGEIQIMKQNYPFAMFLTNLENIGIFNNGTLHYNLTLPTYINKYGKIDDKNKFIYVHLNAIKIIQWLEPILITIYGSQDPFSKLKNFMDENSFSHVSQRCAVSRYISLGTFDTDDPKTGKFLTIKTNEHPMKYNDNWWYNIYNKISAYIKLERIGLDINFNKHFNHGIEIRFFDYISNNDLVYESFEFIIYLMDYILDNENNNLENPIKNELWNLLIINIMVHGKKYNLSLQEINLYNSLFNINIVNNNVVEVYYEIFYFLVTKYNNILKINESKYLLIPIGRYSSLVLEEQEIESYKINNFIKYKTKNLTNNIL